MRPLFVKLSGRSSIVCSPIPLSLFLSLHVKYISQAILRAILWVPRFYIAFTLKLRAEDRPRSRHRDIFPTSASKFGTEYRKQRRLRVYNRRSTLHYLHEPSYPYCFLIQSRGGDTPTDLLHTRIRVRKYNVAIAHL